MSDTSARHPLIEHAHKIFEHVLIADKQKFALFYLNWIGHDHVKIVLEASLLHGDLNEEILTKCSTVEEVDVFINSKLNSL